MWGWELRWFRWSNPDVEIIPKRQYGRFSNLPISQTGLETDVKLALLLAGILAERRAVRAVFEFVEGDCQLEIDLAEPTRNSGATRAPLFRMSWQDGSS